MNIADAFQFQAFYHPTSLAICVPGSQYGPVSYGRLQAMTNAIGWPCLAAGMKAGHGAAILGAVVPTAARVFLDIGLTTSGGYLWAMKVVAGGGSLFFRGSDPAETMQAFGLYQVQCMIGSPASAAEFVGYYESSPDFI